MNTMDYPSLSQNNEFMFSVLMANRLKLVRADFVIFQRA
ncbi:hypothetical protein ABI_23770 [Asticcacaulis biprosthecium C19]|uniref:Uncharacterized protein n=1 Tax=Asticcacaulis biprosthecium C19 TaxID=715226 RepID=F4QNQ7_9CAUL|nr:hypothetical protein ABI_23770 [Asticcacaulis biprosthecium C19]